MVPLIRAHSPNTRVVVDSVDAQFVRDARRAYRLGPSGRPTALLGSDYGDEIVGELNVYAAADCVIAVSQAEADLLGSLMNDQTLAHCVPDSELSVAGRPEFEDRRGMLFVGSFQHPPNADAVRYACQEILPLVPEALRREHPLYVVGDSLDETVRAYAEGTDHVRLVGWVPGTRSLLRACARGARATSLWSRDEAQGDPGADGQCSHGRDVDRRRRTPSRRRAGLPARKRRCLLRRGHRTPARRTSFVGEAGQRRRRCDRAPQRSPVSNALFAALDTALARNPKPPLLPPSARKQLNRRNPYSGGTEVRAPDREDARRIRRAGGHGRRCQRRSLGVASSA